MKLHTYQIKNKYPDNETSEVAISEQHTPWLTHTLIGNANRNQTPSNRYSKPK